jgi:hypothetical protein
MDHIATLFCLFSVTVGAGMRSRLPPQSTHELVSPSRSSMQRDNAGSASTSDEHEYLPRCDIRAAKSRGQADLPE